MRSTEVLRVNGVFDDQQQQAWIAYISALGADPARVRNRWVIMQDEDGYHLHLSLKTPSASGKGGDMLDLATNDVVSTPLVIHLGHERNWPGADAKD